MGVHMVYVGEGASALIMQCSPMQPRRLGTACDNNAQNASYVFMQHNGINLLSSASTRSHLLRGRWQQEHVTRL